MVSSGSSRLSELTGEPYAADRHLDVGGGQWLRIHTVTLAGHEEQEILAEALETATEYLRGGLQVLDELEKVARPLLDAYSALRDQRGRLIKEATELNVTVSPGPKSAKPLGYEEGRYYLRIGDFWVSVDPDALRVLAEAYLKEAEPVARLAGAVGHPVENRPRVCSLVLLTKNELQSGSARKVIAEAFDTWLAWKRDELARS